jgi:membrane protein required for beta-lactamase induction
MYDYKTLRRIIRTLALLFALVLVILVVTTTPKSIFGWISVLMLVVVGIYFTSIPLKLLGEMKDMEAMIEAYKKESQKRN